MNRNLPYMVLPSTRDMVYYTKDETFHTTINGVGLVVLRNALDKELCAHALVVGKKRTNKNTGSSWDEHVLRNMSIRVGNLGRRFVSPMHVVTQSVTPTTRRKNPSYGIIVALQDDTQFMYLPLSEHNNQGMAGGIEVASSKAAAASVTMHAGDVLFFKDALVHVSVAAHKKEQTKIGMHFYCDDV